MTIKDPDAGLIAHLYARADNGTLKPSSAHLMRCAAERLEQLSQQSDTLRLLDSQGHIRPLGEIEREVITFAMQLYSGQRSEVARRLRIGRSTIYRKTEVKS